MSFINTGKISILILMSLIFSGYSIFAGPVPTVQQLKIDTGDITDWLPEDTMSFYANDHLYELIDGGAPQYLDKGCRVTGYQQFTGLEGTISTVFVMDFGKDSNATAMFKQKQAENSGNTVPDQSFPDSTVFVTPNLGGVGGYAHFNNIYIEISLRGFSDQQKAISELNLFLGFFKNKIKTIEKTGIQPVSSAKLNRKNAKQYREVFLLEGRHSRRNASSSGIYNIRGQQLGRIQTMQIIIIKDR
jgi:hypothetical protein